jgi:hypothetical protein
MELRLRNPTWKPEQIIEQMNRGGRANATGLNTRQRSDILMDYIQGYAAQVELTIWRHKSIRNWRKLVKRMYPTRSNVDLDRLQ